MKRLGAILRAIASLPLLLGYILLCITETRAARRRRKESNNV